MLKIFIKLSLLLFFGFSNGIFAQSEIITGTIIDKNGIPIPGVNIIEDSDSYNGAVTDFDGNFVLSVIFYNIYLYFY